MAKTTGYPLSQSDAVRAERARRGLTQEQAAAQLGRSRDWVVRLEAGDQSVRIDLDAMLALERVLGLPLDGWRP